PHLKDRPFTMKRYPHGIDGEVFFQKQAPKGMPDWIPTRQFRTLPREGGPRLVDFPLVKTPEAVLYMVQMNCIDMNAWYSRVDHRQNGHGKTIASVYSVRPKPGAPVSTPLRWEELTPDVRPRDFGMAQALERIERYGDLFASVLEEPRPLAPAAKELERLVS